MGTLNCYQICVVTGTRAEYGLLRPLLFKLRDAENVAVNLVVTGTHLSEAYGNTQTEILKDGFNKIVRIPIPIEDDTKEGMAVSTGVALTKFAEFFRGYKPDILIVLGDRFEILAAVTAAHLIGIPIAHISGGDVTEGAVDDAIRYVPETHMYRPSRIMRSIQYMRNITMMKAKDGAAISVKCRICPIPYG